MQDEQKNEKLADGQIVIPTRERTHGRLYRWFDNFWYHHKWATLFSLFFLIVIVVCTVQMCSKKAGQSDLVVVYAGPYSFMQSEQEMRDLENFLAYHLPEDINKDGKKSISIVNYTTYSKEQLDQMDPQDANLIRPYSVQAHKDFFEHLSVGEFSVALLDPSLYEELAVRSQCLIDICAVFGVTPEGGLYREGADGKSVCYGIRLGDTALYRDSAALKALPEDTVLCLIGATFFGDNDTYEAATAYFEALIDKK